MNSDKMQKYLLKIEKQLVITKQVILADPVLSQDIDFNFEFIPPFSTAKYVDNVKLVFIGQDPTVRRPESRKEIKKTLNLDKKNSLRTYLSQVCKRLQIDIDNEVYATNLYKCFFNIPPADDEKILVRQFKIWTDFLLNEIRDFNKPIIITLGEPLIRQLVHSGKKEVKYYWDYIGQTQSGGNYKCIDSKNNYLQQLIYPLPHQPTWSQNEFYRKYLNHYLDFINQNFKK